MVRILEIEGNLSNCISNGLFLTLFISTLPAKNLYGCCFIGQYDSFIFIDPSDIEMLFISTKSILIMESNYQNAIILLESQKILKLSILERTIQHGLHGCLQFQILKFILQRYVINKFITID